MGRTVCAGNHSLIYLDSIKFDMKGLFMERNIIVKQDEFETMVALLEDDTLTEVLFEREHDRNMVGSVYKARVDNVLPGMQAAFVDFGAGRNGFLHLRDTLAPRLDADGRLQEPELSIDKVLRPGQEIMVQVVKEATGNKGARLTMNPSFPGRFLVLLPTNGSVTISRRIEDEDERQRLLAQVRQLLPQGMGAIIRTAAASAEEDELAQDVRSLLKLWKWLLGKNVASSAVTLLYHDSGLLERVVRDVFNGDIAHIYANSPQTAARMAALASCTAPECLPKIEQPQCDIMAVYNISAQLHQALADKVWLKCGGYLVIQHMEAFTVIDVNTGKYVGSSSQSFANVVLRTNMEAAREVARQMQLRNLGGIIIVDFIDMKEDADRESVLAALNEELQQHRVKTNVLGFTQLGLLEMTRKKNGHSLQELFERPCPFCGGKGSVLSEASVFVNIMAELAELANNSAEKAIYIETNPVVSSYIIGSAGENKAALEKRFGKKLCIKGNPELKMADFVVRPMVGDFADFEQPPFAVGDIVDCFLCEKHNANKNDAICRVNGYVILVRDGAPWVGQKCLLRIIEVQQTYACAELCEN